MAHLIAINGKDFSFEKIKKRFFPSFYYFNPKTSINPVRIYPKKFFDVFNYTSGLKIKIAGRFYSKIIIPRKTETNLQLGSMARKTINLVQKASYVNKSKRGSFSVTV